MKRTMKYYQTKIPIIIYVIFTLICGGFTLLFSEYRILVFQIWYQITFIIWLSLLIAAVVLFHKSKKIKKICDSINHRKEK
ncbi:hypothetical protein ACF13M_000577 [Clostridioides difficile]|nr:conjugal transfer protein [Clostridioides difficile]EKG0799230.1 conjugal transfer protein [Clostridioides difficile]EKS6830849.1 conjugal transfer protein [Clostridioides difficile]MBY2252332.1 conjugal transfer protein [Clostridioides difficile]MCI2384807.1 conjugal transfer protein [Clostridioides difficile]